MSDSFIKAIPVITIAWEIRDQRDYNNLMRYNVFGDEDKKEGLVEAIKELLQSFKTSYTQIGKRS